MVARRYKIPTLATASLCLTLTAFVPSSIAQASAGTSAATAPSVTRASAPAKQSAESSLKNSGAPLTIELDSLKVRFENDGTGTRQLDVRVNAGTEEGVNELKTLAFDYDSANEKIALGFCRVTKPNGSMLEAKPDSVVDGPAPDAKAATVFSELREAHVTPPPIAAGDTLSYEVTITTVKPPAPGEFWFSHSFLTARTAADEELEINVPADRTIHVQTTPQFPPRISTAGDRRIYFWQRSNAAPTQSGSETSKPRDVVLTTFANWDTVGKWFTIMEHTSATATDALAAKSKELTAQQTTDTGKMEALYEFVAKQIHISRIPPEQTNFQIHEAAKVLAAGYGDELDKCNLLAAMLDAAGFDASVVLVPAGEKFDPNLPWPGAVAHAVVAATSGKEIFWMDPSADTLPFRLLLPNSRGKTALVLSSSAAPHFLETPLDPPFQSMQDVEITGNVTSLGKLTAHVRYVLRGDNEFALRSAFEGTPQSQWNAVAQTMASLDGLHGTVANAKPSDPTATRDPFTLDFLLVSPGFIDWSQQRVSIPVLLPALGLPDVQTDSTQPVRLGSPLDVSAKLTLTVPVNDSANVPVGAALKRDYAEYHSEYTSQEHTITAQRTLRFISRELPPSRREDYQAFAAAVQADQSQGLVVENIIPGVPAEATAPELMQAGASEIQDKHFANALLLFQRVAELHPQEPNLWLDMGTAQLELGKYDDAITSFHKHLEANPKDESVNTLLGVAFYDEKNYSQAEAAFQKQIEVKPLDQNAYTYLGAVYLDEKQFDKARSELEKAAVLSPDSVAVQIRLGEAYLELRNKDAALAAFEKAATLSPSALVANDIAYTLAEHKTALDRAKEYAEAAVDQTANSLSQIDLRHVTSNDFVAMSTLPGFWDTLGWVHFQQGEIAEAEPLIQAAWRLNQTGDTGDHLGQLYEARGEKALAIRVYEESLAAGNAPDSTLERLGKLLGATAGSAAAIDAAVKRASAEFVRERTVSLGSATINGKAEFVVLIERAQNGPVARDARFLSGDDKLASLTQRFLAAQFPPILPRGTTARVILRGAVTCSAKSAKCGFVYDRPRDLIAGDR
jgi:tetratricopeptide (TPR) repeat protein